MLAERRDDQDRRNVKMTLKFARSFPLSSDQNKSSQKVTFSLLMTARLGVSYSPVAVVIVP